MGRASFVAALLIVFTSPVAMAELCEVTYPDGSASFVDCCTITEEGNDGACGEVAEALDSVENKALRKAIATSTRARLVKYMGDNPEVPFGFISISPPDYEFWLACCSCVPGKTCSAGWLWNVCDKPSDGTCPAGTLRTICSYDNSLDESVDCTGIDNNAVGRPDVVGSPN